MDRKSIDRNTNGQNDRWTDILTGRSTDRPGQKTGLKGDRQIQGKEKQRETDL
jgi:hypothetical protein